MYLYINFMVWAEVSTWPLNTILSSYIVCYHAYFELCCNWPEVLSWFTELHEYSEGELIAFIPRWILMHIGTPM